MLRPAEQTRSAIKEAPGIKEPEQEPLDPNQRITRSMKAPSQQVPRVPTAASPRVEKHIVTAEQACKKKAKQHRKRRESTRSTPSEAVPAGNTRAMKKLAAIRAAASARPAAKSTRESTKTKTAQSRLMRPTVSSRSKGKALAVRSITKKKMTARQRMDRLENEVHEAMAVMDAETGKLLNYKQLMRNPKYKKKWGISSANEFGRLANGVGGRTKNPTNTIKFIRRSEIPKDRTKDVTYGSFVCNMRPEKKEKERTRFVVGGDRINYPGEVATSTADMLVEKLLFNSVVSTKDAKFMTMDISNFYLMTPLKRPEYIRINIKDIPEEIFSEYNLREIALPNGSVHIVANRGMYGLPQSGLLANELLEKRLNKRGYR